MLSRADSRKWEEGGGYGSPRAPKPQYGSFNTIPDRPAALRCCWDGRRAIWKDYIQKIAVAESAIDASWQNGYGASS